MDANYIENARILQEQAKWQNDSVKIAVMNLRILEEQMYWRAGRTPDVEQFFDEKELYYGKKYNLAGFDFYKGGVFEYLPLRQHMPASSFIIDNFSWRFRHGANDPQSPYYDKDDTLHSGWLTKTNCQESCQTCYVFSPIGAAAWSKILSTPSPLSTTASAPSRSPRIPWIATAT